MQCLGQMPDRADYRAAALGAGWQAPGTENILKPRSCLARYNTKTGESGTRAVRYQVSIFRYLTKPTAYELLGFVGYRKMHM